MTKLKPIRQERASDAVYTALRQAILSSLLRPGEKLDVNRLAVQLNVSLTPVRNAIHLLAAEGLIEVRPRSGTCVATVTAQDLRETFEIRRALECLAVENACTAITADELADLRDILAVLNQPVKEELERQRHEQHNARFHLAILKAARNERLLAGYQRLNAHIQIARIHAGETDWRLRLDRERAEHVEIVDAIAQREPARAVQAMRAHIDRACQSLVEAIEKKNATPER